MILRSFKPKPLRGLALMQPKAVTSPCKCRVMSEKKGGIEMKKVNMEKAIERYNSLME